MEYFELKDYIKESCKFLGIGYEKISEDLMYVRIPEHLVNEFSGVSEYQISFVKTSHSKQTYITFESFFTQKLAKLVAQHNHGVGHIVKYLQIEPIVNYVTSVFPNCTVTVDNSQLVQADHLYGWCKTTIHGQLIEEYIKGFQVELESGFVTPIAESLEAVLRHASDETIDGLTQENINHALTKALEAANQDAEQFVESIKQQTKEQLQTEINRITSYYETLIQEHQSAETSKGHDPKTERELLVQEREALIQQQKIKFSITESEVVIEPVALLLARNMIEHGSVLVRNDFGQVNFQIQGDKRLEIHCEIDGSRKGPFTITSENAVVTEKHAFLCTSCTKLFDDRKLHSCFVCADSLCPSCITLSSISKLPLCHQHHLQCPTCLKHCAEKEQHLCSNCNQFYCSHCNAGNLCCLCSNLTSIHAVTPIIQRIIMGFPNAIKAKKFDYSEKGNRIALLGKGLMFKEFFVVYDKREERVIEFQKFGLFNKRK